MKKNHLAENDSGGPTVTEFRGPHGMEEGKREILGIRSSVRQRSARSSPPRRRRWDEYSEALERSAVIPSQSSAFQLMRRTAGFTRQYSKLPKIPPLEDLDQYSVNTAGLSSESAELMILQSMSLSESLDSAGRARWEETTS